MLPVGNVRLWYGNPVVLLSLPGSMIHYSCIVCSKRVVLRAAMLPRKCSLIKIGLAKMCLKIHFQTLNIVRFYFKAKAYLYFEKLGWIYLTIYIIDPIKSPVPQGCHIITYHYPWSAILFGMPSYVKDHLFYWNKFSPHKYSLDWIWWIWLITSSLRSRYLFVNWIRYIICDSINSVIFFLIIHWLRHLYV